MSLLSTKSLAKSVAAALGVASLIAGVCSAETTLIKDAKIHTLSSQGVLQSGDVLFEDGVIKAVGEDLTIEADTVIDGTGKVVTPGIFAQITQIGLVELGSQEQTADARTEHEEQGASFSVDKVYNHNSTLVAVNRSNGVTRTLVAPQVGKMLNAS